jgi:hypothetical protein
MNLIAKYFFLIFNRAALLTITKPNEFWGFRTEIIQSAIAP